MKKDVVTSCNTAGDKMLGSIVLTSKLFQLLDQFASLLSFLAYLVQAIKKHHRLTTLQKRLHKLCGVLKVADLKVADDKGQKLRIIPFAPTAISPFIE